MEWTRSDLMRLSLDADASNAPALTHRIDTQQASEVVPLERAFRQSMQGVDESVLLAEAEELFATLDAAAFASRTPSCVDSSKSSWTGLGSPVSQVGSRLRSTSTTSPRRKKLKHTPSSSASSSPSSSPSPVARSDATATVVATRNKKSAPSWRDKVREEVMQLRSESTKLEVQLLLLEQQNRSSTIVRNTRVQIWKRLAERQLRLRELASVENAQLKAMMATLLQGGDGQLQQRIATSLPNYLHGPRKVSITPSRDAAMANVFEPLLRRLDTSYAEVDAIFRENGMSRTSVEPNSYMQRKTRRLGASCRYIELGDTRTLPFPWRAVGNYSWLCNRAWHLKDAPYEYQCVDRASDTFAVNYRVTHKAFGATESVDFKLAVRRYVESDRFVVVYACQSDGEQELAGASVTKVGWVVSRDADLARDAEPITAVQSCMHVFTSAGVKHACSEREERLVNLMMCAFEEDVVFIGQSVDNRLLEDARTRSARLTSVDTFSSQHMAPPVPRVQLSSSESSR